MQRCRPKIDASVSFPPSRPHRATRHNGQVADEFAQFRAGVHGERVLTHDPLVS